MTKKVLGHRISPTTISVTFDDGVPHILSSDHPKFAEIGDKLRRRDYDGLEDLISPADAIQAFANGQIEIRGGLLFYNGEQVNLAVVPVILDLIKEGADASILLRFLERLMLNPSMRSRKTLWDFIERHGIVLYDGPMITHPARGVIDATGWLVLYKGVNPNYTDCHTQEIDNSPGTWPAPLDRSRVDDDPDVACSYGYHAGDFEYVKSFGQRKMVVLVDPANIVAVPRDCNASKVRMTEYYVLKEVEGEFRDFEESTYDGEEDDDLPEWLIVYENGHFEYVEARSIEDARDQASHDDDIRSIERV